MSESLNIIEFLSPVDLIEIKGDDTYKKDQIGSTIGIYEEEFPEIAEVEIILVGCGEQRGNGILGPGSKAPNAIRKQFYAQYFWHEGISIADIGDIKPGASYYDTLAALKTVVSALLQEGKTVIILGGSHDLTLSQYGAYVANKQLIEATVVDTLIDLDMESPFSNDHFLMDMLTGEPNFIKHYNHVGFQSYLVHPGMLQTLDKLKFDCFRVGHVKEHIEEIEPPMRSSSMLSFDISAIAHAYAPANWLTPNGLNGEEACILMQYAGMSSEMSSIGIYGYDPNKDVEALTAKQISQMMWYFLDGRYSRRKEAGFGQRDQFNEFQMIFSEVETLFLQSKRTGRWWMRLPNKQFIPCSYKDYLLAASDEIPDRWFRAQQREMLPPQ